MCTLKFHTIFVKDKYKMDDIWFFFKYVILWILPYSALK